jgi:hypothetical protein
VHILETRPLVVSLHSMDMPWRQKEFWCATSRLGAFLADELSVVLTVAEEGTEVEGRDLVWAFYRNFIQGKTLQEVCDLLHRVLRIFFLEQQAPSALPHPLPPPLLDYPCLRLDPNIVKAHLTRFCYGVRCRLRGHFRVWVCRLSHFVRRA